MHVMASNWTNKRKDGMDIFFGWKLEENFGKMAVEKIHHAPKTIFWNKPSTKLSSWFGWK
jgi:hypothetical protein